MKKDNTRSFCSTGVLIFMVAFPLVSLAQVSITLHLPPPGTFSPEDLTQMISINNPGSSRQVYLTATVEESQAGLVFAGSSAEFEMITGFSTPTYQTLEPIDIEFVDPRFEQFVLQSNNIPSGSYVVCVRVIEKTTGEELGLTCIPHNVFQPSAPVLIYPADGTAITEANPVFLWLPPGPEPPAEVVYNFRLYELFEGQQPYDALRSNPPFYAESNVLGTILLYGLQAPPLVPDHRYVWQVQAVSSQGIAIGENEGLSDFASFLAGVEEEREILPISPLAACVGEVTEGLKMETVEFQWMANGQFSGFQVIVSANACGVYTPPTTPPTTPPPAGPPTTVSPKPTPPVKPPVITNPVGPADSVAGGGPANPPPVTTGGGVTVTPVGGGAGEVDWPDEGETDLPPLPPGWEWTPAGPRWTGEIPPEPPALPPGWEWGPLRPVWTGEGADPVERVVIAVSEPVSPNPMTVPGNMPAHYSTSLNLGDILKPGQAFVYQICGVFTGVSGQPNAYLSEPQCLRYAFSADSEVEVTPLSCDPCLVELQPDTAPSMNGGLDPPVESMEIGRDEFVVLKAIGLDYDQIWWRCQPKPNCPESGSKDMRITSSRVRFSWKVVNGEGDFVEIGCSGASKETAGDRVIFQPPFVAPDSTKTTNVKLSIIDDNPSQPLDKTVNVNIKITTERKKDNPNYYKVKIESDSFQLPTPTQISGEMGTCRTGGPAWSRDEDLTTPTIILPQTADASKLVYKELIRLTASDVRDPDNVKVWCISERCPTNDKRKTYEDDVQFEWTIAKGGGRFVKGNTGRFVIYEAPETEGAVEIEVRVSNASGLKISDKKPGPGKITLKVYEPGVRMERTDLAWLPGASNQVVKKSFLVYREGNEWKQSLQHQCRIHYAELLNVSEEPGICLNWPPEVLADSCIDMAFLKSTQWEVFDTVSCTRWNHADTTWFKKANSLKPVREFTINVRCYDYGAYATIRSLANSDGKPAGLYKSVPWKKEEQYHATQYRNAKTLYEDNRVSVPRDVDENHIADGGWLPENRRLSGAGKVNDPIKGVADGDNVPLSGFPGDGISNYEEYRGFYVKGKHERLDIDRKNLLLWNRNNIGLGSLPNSGIIGVQVNDNEMDAWRVINFNRCTDSLGFDQKGLRLITWQGAANERVGQADAIGLDSCTWVWINAGILNNTEVKNYAIAHELSHGIGVWHHGEGIIYGHQLRNDSVKIGNTWYLNNVSDTLTYFIACPGGITSGDVDCWMRYMYTTGYCIGTGTASNFDCTNNNLETNISGWTLYVEQNIKIGKFITDVTSGTGVNATNKCGKSAGAGRGKCRTQIKINCKP
jgi:hypothetical protein